MAVPALARRDHRSLAVRVVRDRVLLRDFLEHDRLFAAYAICDLDEQEFGRTRWGMAFEGDRPTAVVLEYNGPSPQPIFCMGQPDGIRTILGDLIRTRTAYIAFRSEATAAVGAHYRLDPGPEMVRMWVDRSTFRPYPAAVSRLLPVEVSELNRLYQLGFTSWLPASAIADGVYYAIRANGRVVSAAGTHVISDVARLGVVGNVMTHADHRGRGYATAVTGAVTGELLRSCDQVVLNVRADNVPAIQAYRRLGYQEHCRFEERLVHRLEPAWSSWTASVRRLLGGRSTGTTSSR